MRIAQEQIRTQTATIATGEEVLHNLQQEVESMKAAHQASGDSLTRELREATEENTVLQSRVDELSAAVDERSLER